MAFDLIQMPCKFLESEDDKFSWRLLVFNLSADTKSTATIGRHSKCDFVINLPKLPCFLSRMHATMRIGNGKLYIKDLNSTNGTFKNNVMLAPNKEYLLADGDHVSFGCKSDSKPIPGKAVSPQDTPIVFRILKTKSRSNKDATKRKDGRGIEDDVIDITDENSPSSISSPKPSTSKAKKNSASPKDRKVHKRKASLTKSDNKKKFKAAQADDLQTTISPGGVVVEEKCSATECKASRYVGIEPVTWVQCDACDQWYHTVCVGCNYDEVKHSNEQFYCGLCPKSKN